MIKDIKIIFKVKSSAGMFYEVDNFSFLHKNIKKWYLSVIQSYWIGHLVFLNMSEKLGVKCMFHSQVR